MITIRQIERLFLAQQWPSLYRELMANRPEAATHYMAMTCGHTSQKGTKGNISEHNPTASLARAVPIAALAMIRLDELSQTCQPFYRRLLNVLLTSQQKDGGWGEPLTTALALRALLTSNGQGVAIHGALAYLTNLQKTEGIWPKEPIRRLPADAFTSAFILHQLGEFEIFRTTVRFEDALFWFATHERTLDEPTRRLWSHAKTRCRMTHHHHATATLWSPQRPAA